jgi:hypothetical protein
LRATLPGSLVPLFPCQGGTELGCTAKHDSGKDVRIFDIREIPDILPDMTTQRKVRRLPVVRWLLLPTAVLLLPVAPSLDAGGSASDPRVIDKWIANLDSKDFETRQRATRDVLALKEAALEPLKRALRLPKKDLVFKARVEKLLGQLALFEREGPAVNGLRIFLLASNDTLRLGEEMILITTLVNVSTKDLFIPVVSRPSGNDFTLAINLHCLLLTDQLQGSIAKQQARPVPQIIRLPAKDSIEFRTAVTLGRSATRAGDKTGLVLALGEGFLELPTSESHRLRIIHTGPMIERDVLRKLVRNRQGFKGFNGLWCGTVRSNDVVVSVGAEKK